MIIALVLLQIFARQIRPPTRVTISRRADYYSKILSSQYDAIHRSKRANYAKRDTPSDRYDRLKAMMDELPEVKRVNTHESGGSSSSDELVGEHPDLGKHRGGRNDLTEAGAHKLRRQRLAQSPSLLINSALNYTTRACSPLRSSFSSTNCNQRLRQSQRKRSTGPPRAKASTKSQPRRVASNLNKREKHVAFKEPVTPERRSRTGTCTTHPVSPVLSCLPAPLKGGYHGGIDPMGHRMPEESFESQESDDASIFAFRETVKADATRDQSQRRQGQHSTKHRTPCSNAKETHSNLHSVTVRKESKEDKIGIFLQLHKFKQGNRLVVSHISPTGKFANSGIEFGDIVVSINSEDMLENPQTEKALEIVTTATETITIVVQKNVESNDTQLATPSTDGNIHMLYPEKAERIDDDNEVFSNNKVRKREKIAGDGSMLISKDTEIKGSVSITTNESWKLSGVIVVNIEKSHPSEKPGIRLGIKETATGRAIYISKMSQSSPFTKTPIRTGDVILSINNMSLHNQDDVVDAYSALGKSGKRITLVAKKGGESLNDFLLDERRQEVVSKGKNRSGEASTNSLVTAHTVGTTISGGSERAESFFSSEPVKDMLTDEIITFKPKRMGENNAQKDDVDNASRAVSTMSTSCDDFEFDEQSYGASLFGYNASSSVTIAKKSPDEDIGVGMLVITTEWGRLLVVSNIAPRSVACDTDLKVGDAILAINGTSFRRNPSAAKASSLVRDAPRVVRIEFQKLSSFSPAVPVDPNTSKIEKVEKSEEHKSMPTKSPESQTSQTLEKLIRKERPTFSGGPLSSGKQKEGESHSSPKRPKSSEKRQKLRIIVTKESKGQDVGIGLKVLNNDLIVTKTSSKGLLRNAPLVYGDVVLSINGVSFRNDPDANEALKVVKDTLGQVTFEILKMKNIDDGMQTKAHSSKGTGKY
eukprot:jgi/Psemu1/290108/fgenesh1_pg.448_\